MLKHDSNSVEIKTTAQLEKSDDRGNRPTQDKAYLSATIRFEQVAHFDNRENVVQEKVAGEVQERNQDKTFQEATTEHLFVNSSCSIGTNLSHSLQSDEVRDANRQHQGKATFTIHENHHQQHVLESLSELQLQSYYSIKMNVKAYCIFIIFPLISIAFSLLCLLFLLVGRSMFDTCSTLFATTVYLHGVCIGFYSSIFNPLCFVGHTHDFIVLKQRCFPIRGIARSTRRLIYRFKDPNNSQNTHDAVATMV